MGQDRDSLSHYGVLGMKWGVHRGQRDKVFTKAQKKMSKLDKKATKAQRKYSKASRSYFSSEDKVNKLHEKARRTTYKAAKWYQKVSKVLGDESASKMRNSQGADMGRRYADWFIYGDRG